VEGGLTDDFGGHTLRSSHKKRWCKMTNSRTNISSLIENSRKELLDLGLRNPLLNYRSSRARGIEVVDELPVEVFRILVRERRLMSFKAAPERTDAQPEEGELLVQPGDENGNDRPAARHLDHQLQTNLTSARLQTRLIKTERDARTFVEEQGVNILYLALGMLHWFSPRSDLPAKRCFSVVGDAGFEPATSSL
jgi:hypothetical protein